MKLLKNISLTRGAFGLVLFLSVASMAILVPYQYAVFEAEIESQGKEVVKREMSRLQDGIETEYREGHLTHTEKLVLATGLNNHVTKLLLLTADKTIIFSTRLAWKGQRVESVLPSFDGELLEKVDTDKRAKVVFSGDRSSISAIYPVNFSVTEKQLRENRGGFLYLQYDLSRDKAAVWSRLVQDNILSFLVNLVSAICLVIFIHRMASRPLQVLVSSSQKLAAGKLGNLVALNGARELVALEESFNNMSDQLSTIHKALVAKTALYNVLSETNQSIVRLHSAEELYAEICRIAVELGGFKLAWIGLVDDESGNVKPVASKGVAEAYLSKIVVSVSPEQAEGRGATGKAIRQNHYVIVNDFLQAAAASPWRDAAREAGIRSSGAFPISIEGKVVGAFNVYADSVGYFSEEVIDLLSEMAVDISFALANYQREEARKRAESLLSAQQKVLEMIAAGAPLVNVLERLCQTINSLLEESKGTSSILLLDKGKLLFGAAPGLPDGYNQMIDGVGIGPKVGSCGTAAFSGRRIIVSDIQNDPLWSDFRSLAEQYGLAACWSTPVMSANHEVLGTFAIYHREPTTPSQQELDIADRFVHLCGLAIERDRSIEQIKQREENLSVTLSSIGDGVIAVDVAGRVTRLNPIAEALTGWRADEAFGRPLYEVFHIINTQTRIKLESPVEKVIMTGKIMGLANHTSLISKDGSEYHIADSAAPIIGEDGVLRGVILVFHDVTKEYALRESLRQNHEKLLAFHKVMPDLGFVFDEKGTYLEIYGNEAEMLFKEREALLGKTIKEIIPEKMAEKVLSIIHKTLQTGEGQKAEYELKVLDGVRTFEGRTALMERGVKSGTGTITWMARDVTDRKRAEEEIEQLAFFDPLTKLPNRRLLLDRLEHEVFVVKRHQCSAALLFLDLDHFKTLNDSLGHSVGDSLLEQVGQRLSGQVRGEDTVARFGGDEFVVLLSELSSDQEIAAGQARGVAEKIQAALSSPFFLYEHEHHISVSIGISLFSKESEAKGEDVLKHADSAMYRSKALGRNRISFYRPDMQEAADVRLRLEKDLRWALKNDQLTPFYQPQVDQQGNCVGLEVLLRWEHAEWGMVSPVEFIPVAEESGLILAIGEQVLRKSCQQVRQWQEKGLFSQTDQHIAVNISPRQFSQDDFIERVVQILNETKLPPSMLFLEITEGLVIDGVDEVILKMEKLKALGIRFSMDDFGTGYSSLSYLKRLPLAQLKIDRSFVMDIAHDANDRAIIDVILAVAERLELNVVAEGVETEEQLNYLIENGCGIFQGYYFGKPMSATDFEKWIIDKR